MQTAIVETFQSTMNKCFATVVEDILGRTVKEEIFVLLSRNGIRTSEIAGRFDDVVGVLTSAFGYGARVLVSKTVTGHYKTYSQQAGSNFCRPSRDQTILSRERETNELLTPP